MNENYALQFIFDRMKDMGFKREDFSHRPEHVYSFTPSVIIQADNEYYFLMTMPLPSGYKIIANNNQYNDTNSQLGISGIQEFTGKIEITALSGAIDLEFIKVIVSKNFN